MAVAEHSAVPTPAHGPGGLPAWTWGVVAVVLVLLFAGIPDAGALLGSGSEVPEGAWHLWYTSGPLWTYGLKTPLLAFPDGEGVWPILWLEGTLWAPLVHLLGVAWAWNSLVLVRFGLLATGTALWLRRQGVWEGWSLLVALAPAVLQGVDDGWPDAGSLCWMPWVLLLLDGTRGSHIWRGPVAALLLLTSPVTALATLAVQLVLKPQSWSWPSVQIGWGLVILGWLAQLDVVSVEVGRAIEQGVLSTADSGAGSGLGLLGMGSSAWGGPLLLLGLLGLSPVSGSKGIKGFVMVVVGSLLALVPLASATTVALVQDQARLGVVAWMGLALVLGELERPRSWLRVLLVGLVAGPFVGWSNPTAQQPVAEATQGPVLVYPIETHGPRWSLYHQTHHQAAISTGLWRSAVSPYLAMVSTSSWTPKSIQKWAEPWGFRHLVVDPDKNYGDPGSVVISLGGTVSPIKGKTYDDTTLQPLSYQPVFEDMPHPEGAAPVAPLRTVTTQEGGTAQVEDWSYQDPVLLELVNMDHLDETFTSIRIFVSSDGEDWRELPGPIAHSLTSLGVGIANDEALVISTMIQSPYSTNWKPPFLHPGTVVALTTDNLEDWGLRRYAMDEGVMLIDPEMFWVDGEPV
ncbi:MAG: hypothetical protein QGG40_10140, partial [Myxococcota bacterium]|nr:hypothetical protein [Myxococcota bacterium]